MIYSKILKKLELLNQEKSNYLDLLENNSTRYDEEYLFEKIRICRHQINILLEVLEDEEEKEN